MDVSWTLADKTSRRHRAEAEAGIVCCRRYERIFLSTIQTKLTFNHWEIFLVNHHGAGQVRWILKKRMRGRRRPGQLWVVFVAAQFIEVGLERCTSAPPCFLHAGGDKVLLKVHMDDVHGRGSEQDELCLMEKLSEIVALKKKGSCTSKVANMYI